MTDRWAPIEAPLDHLMVPPQTAADAHPTLVLLHGRGATAQDLLPLVGKLRRDDLLLLSAQAPYELSGPFGMGYAWYEMHEIGEPDPASFGPSLTRLRGFLDAVVTGYPVDTNRLFVLGFSQGAVMALAAGVEQPGRFAGIMALSGYLPESADLAARADLDHLAVFMGHGTADEIIPAVEGQRARDALVAHGAHVTYREYAAAHNVALAELEDIRAWLAELLSEIATA